MGLDWIQITFSSLQFASGGEGLGLIVLCDFHDRSGIGLYRGLVLGDGRIFWQKGADCAMRFSGGPGWLWLNRQLWGLLKDKIMEWRNLAQNLVG